MTNAQIINAAAQQLAEEGKIRYTGNILKGVNAAGEEVEIKETEPIHTYNVWKDLGYQVQKGQKAVVQIMIWKHTGSKMEEVPTTDGNVQMIDKGHMFMKKASFFSLAQVEKIA